MKNGWKFLLNNKNMKKICCLFAFSLSVLLIPVFGNFNVTNAETIDTDYKYEYSSSSLYEVDYINDSGTFDKVSEYDNYDSALALMKTNKDYVVRCKVGCSPSRIVAMNSGLVYSYPRGSSSTQNIYQEWGSNKDKYTTTYVSRRYEMTYIDTPYMSNICKGTGYVHVIMNGFDGYADLEYTDLVPSKFIDKGLPIYLGGPYGSNDISAYKVIPEANYYVIKPNGNYNDLQFCYHYAYPDGSGYMETYTLKVDNAENYSFLNIGTKYFSDNGYDFYTDYKKTTKVGTCYNYYQFLPIRTKTQISSSTMDSFLKKNRSDYSSSVMNGKGNVFVNSGDEYGFNAALLYALACQESAYGTSGYAVNRNNLFGWSAYDDSPGDASYFSSVDVAIKEQMGRNLRKYADYSDWRYNGAYFGNKGSGFNLKYASDPYWGNSIGAIYYSLDKLANNNDGNLTDYNRWSLGLIKNFGAKIYYDEACTKQICSANYTPSRQVANIVVLLEDEGNCYKIQFSNPISNGSVIADVEGVFGYSWSKSIAYIKSSDIQVLNDATVPKKELEHQALTSVNNVELSNNELTISGIGAISNVNFDDETKISHIVKLINFEDEDDVLSFDAGVYDANGFSLNDGFNYKYSGFEVTIDLSDINIGSYYAIIETICGDYDYISVLRTSSLDHRNISNKYEDITYRFSTNQEYAYRIEIDIQNTDLDYSLIEKPSKRDSLRQFDTLSIGDDGVVNFSGYSMIYYLNYDAQDENRYLLHLVDIDSGNAYTYNLNNVETPSDVVTLIGSIYDISYISFEKDIDLTQLSNGNYSVILEVNSSDEDGTYYDLFDFFANGRILPSKVIEDRSYSFYSNSKNKLMLKITGE